MDERDLKMPEDHMVSQSDRSHKSGQTPEAATPARAEYSPPRLERLPVEQSASGAFQSVEQPQYGPQS